VRPALRLARATARTSSRVLRPETLLLRRADVPEARMIAAFLQGIHNALQAAAYVAGLLVVFGPAVALAIDADRTTPRLRRVLAAPAARWRHRRRVRAIHRQYRDSGRSA
jgi:hypothetical protein